MLITQTAQQRLIGVRVGIDEAWQRHHAGRIEDVIVRSSREARGFADVDDRVVLNDDRGIGENATALIHRHDGSVVDQQPSDTCRLPECLTGDKPV